MERKTSNASDANMSIELFKELFTNILREQEKKLLNFLRNSISETKLRQNWVTQVISDNNISLKASSKETDGRKLNLETSQEITNNKLKEINHKLKNINNNMGMKLMSYSKKMIMSVKS